jgi:uncharacterized membrane protein YczE
MNGKKAILLCTLIALFTALLYGFSARLMHAPVEWAVGVMTFVVGEIGLPLIVRYRG